MTDRPRLLVSAPDRSMRAAVRGALATFSIVEATDEITTSALGVACRPDLLVLDATDLDRTEPMMRALRDDFRTAFLARVYIVDGPTSAETIGSAFGGADDYVVCPFEDEELRARVSVSLRRSKIRRGSSPLTGLPANAAVHEEVTRRLGEPDAFVLLYIDVDDFKAYNDRHGFARGDEVIAKVAACIRETLGSGCFAGHVGGDDFVVLAPTERAEACAADIVRRFDTEGTTCTISVGIAGSGSAKTAGELAERAAAAKATAKARAGSSWSVLS